MFRYTVVGEAPRCPVCVMVGAPHTANRDFPLTIAIAWASGLNPVWLGKREMFVWPVGWIFRKMGGVAVDRRNPEDLVGSLIGVASSSSRVAILIAPEGSLAPVEYWKSGFRRIARGADVPVALSFLDRPTRTGGFGPTLSMTDDPGADMDVIRAFYADKHGVKPGHFAVPRLREEELATGDRRP
jgi:1-acyl-sn-glycerol-3-phosphate acyltransferase